MSVGSGGRQRLKNVAALVYPLRYILQACKSGPGTSGSGSARETSTTADTSNVLQATEGHSEEKAASAQSSLWVRAPSLHV